MSSSRDPHRDSGDDVGYFAATHLLDQGARRLVHLAGSLQLHAISGRLRGIQRAVTEVGVSLDVVRAPNLKIGSGRELGLEVLQSRRIAGVICPSVPLAVGVIQAATDLDIGVPDDLLVIGYDDDHFGRAAHRGDSPTVKPCPPNRNAGPARHSSAQHAALARGHLEIERNSCRSHGRHWP